MRVAITGVAGFIGSNLAKMLQSKARVVGLDDFSTGSAENILDLEIDFVEGSILDTDLLNRIFKGCDAVIHLAAIPSVPRSLVDPLKTHEVNATGTLSVLEAARRHSNLTVIIASSSSVYGANEKIPKEENDLLIPVSPYAVSKVATEQYALAWQRSYGLKTLAFRFFNVYGPGQAANHAYAAAIPAFLSAAVRGEPLKIYGDGMQTRDFTYVSSVCQALMIAAARGVTSLSPVNLAFGTRTSLIEIVGEIERLVERPVRIEFLGSRSGDVLHSQADGSRFQTLFPDVKPVPLKDGLKATLQWLQSSATY